MSYPDERDYREWSEMKAEGIEVETMQEYVDEVRGFHDFDEPEPMDAEDYYLSDLAAWDAYLEEQADATTALRSYREIDCGGFD